VIWVAALALWIAAEKTLSAGGRLAAAAGVGLILWGTVRQLL